MNQLMQCGHSANATDGKTGKPCCVICVGIDAGATIPATAPDLTGRKARCPDCKTLRDSSLGLAFFEYRKDKEFDSFYCGCRGFD